MKLPKSQSGLAPVAMVLILVILGIVGFAAWKVYDAKKSTDKSLSNASQNLDQITRPGAQEDKAFKLPEGYVEYSNQELGFRFAYPKTWGEVSVKAGPETPHLVSGSEYEASFSLNSKVSAGVRSKDWKHDENLGHGGIVNAMAYAGMSKEQFTQDGYGHIEFESSNSFIVGTGIGGLGCYGVGHVLVHSLNDDKYPAIVFLYFDEKDESGVEKDEYCTKETYKKYLVTPHLEELKLINTTIKSL